jgi:hypothetical protein
VDTDLALKDPLVRQRLTAPAQPTSPDLQLGSNPNVPKADRVLENPDVWYLRYRDRKGQWCKARATTRQVLQRLGEGVLSVEAQAAHLPQGDFRPLAGYDEFRLAVSKAQRLPKRRPAVVPDGRAQAEAAVPVWRWWVLLGVSIVLVLGALAAVLLTWLEWW